jgi:hypothetical protein
MRLGSNHVQGASEVMKGVAALVRKRREVESEEERHHPELALWIERRVDTGGALVGARLSVDPSARRDGKRWLSNPLRTEWNRAALAVGVRVRMYEGTTHTTATEALRAGRRLEEIQAALGHRDRRSAERSARLAEVTPVGELFRRRWFWTPPGPR